MTLTEKEVAELGGVDVDDLITMKAEFDFGLAFALLNEGEAIRRKGTEYGFKLHNIESSGERKLMVVKPDGEVICDFVFSGEHLAAKDWQVMKLSH
ncbi:hypothetical protein AJ85_05710 [Alkalihalobacillus alcalophilus ATCC 27647 = CGMCC 1.3604]|uniref:Uncharacterized protein n=1 Tax=Alkalihalobacillus alcalophilus ATCC 27647 = CGMCC 1.3604 TaxID=1218173 RepID=A0A094WJ48_ALKAL|nr:hypothetical protein [Alkalihalobacillus alcalophilus]YP_009276829.1 hypothetical protein BH791_gp23 [Bacillus phage BalMu-1]AJA42401.1 hypothetical protein BalMu1_B23 [Bacillus phage BalMu-1]AJA42457.1 hypothetical protein BalMu1_A23 [Bacillus phage BalMu-1]KGA96856.1 hypothetical protein BALCAV_0213640 [Alkalihalobacillus alcalophilus ATCC 27647 = CGMCC 1.3604]MED1561145.1 hypothetical protein [Alkalihalobacillus alcalophilus]THG91319.1 hypothetical protein AJ85_05710 [Alkalihalobacillus